MAREERRGGQRKKIRVDDIEVGKYVGEKYVLICQISNTASTFLKQSPVNYIKARDY